MLLMEAHSSSRVQMFSRPDRPIGQEGISDILSSNFPQIPLPPWPYPSPQRYRYSFVRHLAHLASCSGFFRHDGGILGFRPDFLADSGLQHSALPALSCKTARTLDHESTERWK
jgi:hypothetical protein